MMISVPRTRWFVAALAIASLSAAACTNQDADRDDVVSALEDANVPKDQAECVANELDKLDQGQLNDVASASDLDDLENEELRNTVTAAVTKCIGGGGAESTTTSAPAGDTTTTTAAP